MLPTSIIKELVAEGVSTPEIVQIMQQLATVVAADRESGRAAAPSIAQYIAQQLRAGVDDATIVCDLVARGIEREDGRQLLRDARQVWTRLHVQQRGMAVSRTVGALGLVVILLIGGVHVLRMLDGTSSPAMTPSVVVQLNPTLVARVGRLPNAVVVADSLNVRSGPGAEYPLLFQLHAHDSLRVIGRMEETGRYLVQLPNDRMAWVRSDPDAVRLDIPRDRLPRFVFAP